MPTLLLEKGFRFYFYSNENNEPAHVHVEKGSATGKIWLEPILKVDYLVDFTTSEQKDILQIVESKADNFKTRWNEYFRK